MPKTKGKKSEKLNVKLLEKISEHILAEPRRINMALWLTEDERYEHKCHTVGCIAGWAVALKGTKEDRGYYAVRGAAERLLKISHDDSEELFMVENWPTKFVERLQKHDEGTKGYAKAVAARIKDFIKEKEEEEKAA